MCMVAVYLAATILGVAFLYTLSYWIVGGKVSVHSVHKRYGGRELKRIQPPSTPSTPLSQPAQSAEDKPKL
jgi:hypothetical protein